MGQRTIRPGHCARYSYYNIQNALKCHSVHACLLASIKLANVNHRSVEFVWMGESKQETPNSEFLLTQEIDLALPFRQTANSKREFVPRDQVFHYLSFTVHYNYTKIGRFTPILSIKIVLNGFYPLISHFENFST